MCCWSCFLGLFHAFDENRDNHIDFKEISCGLSACCRGPVAERQKCKARCGFRSTQTPHTSPTAAHNKLEADIQGLNVFFFLKESPDRSVQSWTALIRTSTGAWNYICTGSSGSVLVHWTARCIGVVLHQHHKRLFGLFHFQFALKCLMWTVMGFCLEMSFMKWWWPCWRCGRTIGQTYSL